MFFVRDYVEEGGSWRQTANVAVALVVNVTVLRASGIVIAGVYNVCGNFAVVAVVLHRLSVSDFINLGRLCGLFPEVPCGLVKHIAFDFDRGDVRHFDSMFTRHSFLLSVVMVWWPLWVFWSCDQHPEMFCCWFSGLG